MPKISKAAKSDRNITKRDTSGAFTCTRCGRVYSKQRSNFPSSQSPLFAKNGGYLPICGSCVDELWQDYTKEFGDDVAAARRVCMKLDIYWEEKLFISTRDNLAVNSSAIRTYITKLNLYRYMGKTFDFTLREEARKAELEAQDPKDTVVEAQEDAQISAPTDEVIRFWGEGYTYGEYAELEERFNKWTGGVPLDELSPGAETLYRQICVLELVIKKNANAGRPIEQSVNQLNNLIGSVNAKPTQQIRSDGDDDFDGLPIGVGIRLYENTRPIPETLPEYRDVDGIVRYIIVWVLGPLCKLFHIKNRYSQLYEEEMARLRVERPDVADEDDEDLLYDVFGDLKRESK